MTAGNRRRPAVTYNELPRPTVTHSDCLRWPLTPWCCQGICSEVTWEPSSLWSCSSSSAAWWPPCAASRRSHSIWFTLNCPATRRSDHCLRRPTAEAGWIRCYTEGTITHLTRAVEGGLRITPSGGGHIMPPPPSISAPMRASATNFGGYLGTY